MTPNRLEPPAAKRGLFHGLQRIYRAFDGLAALADRLAQPPAPRMDTTQLGITCEATFLPSFFGTENYVVTGERIRAKVSPDDLTAFVAAKIGEGMRIDSITPEARGQSPTITGRTRIYCSLRPTGMLVTEIVEATYGKPGAPDVVLYENVPQAVSDLVLTGAFAGSTNAFPFAPGFDSGVNCALFGIGVPLAWPMVNGGIDLTLTFAVERTILGRARVGIPDGYDPTPKRITVRVRANLTGDQRR